jgi:hypothetical protein
LNGIGTITAVYLTAPQRRTIVTRAVEDEARLAGRRRTEGEPGPPDQTSSFDCRAAKASGITNGVYAQIVKLARAKMTCQYQQEPLTIRMTHLDLMVSRRTPALDSNTVNEAATFAFGPLSKTPDPHQIV